MPTTFRRVESPRPPHAPATVLNDTHAGLNPTSVASVLRPDTVVQAQACIRHCRREERALVPMGARHAMGGQQLLSDGIVMDTAALSGVDAFDDRLGRVVVGAGTRWPALLQWLRDAQGNNRGWTVRQKQTGADDFSLGGSLASNIHGRGLTLAPLVDDVEWIELIDPAGELIRASRDTRPELFALAIGGYGLFGLVTRLCLRLATGRTLQRKVRLLRIGGLMRALDSAIADGCIYGDFQFAIDPASTDFLDLGILSCYLPVAGAPDPRPARMGANGFRHLLRLAHLEPSRAFDEYARFYLASDGQRYPTEAQHSGLYLDGYHEAIDRQLGHRGSEMITELYVPRNRLADFMPAAADLLRRCGAQPVYGTVRLIERDQCSALAWARERWACIVFNLHVRHDPTGVGRAQAAFRALIDLVLERGGSFYLTYHRWALARQIEAAYPGFRQWLRLKRELDPREVFQSDCYRHWRDLFGADR